MMAALSIARGCAPACALGFARAGKASFAGDVETFFDLASVTKPMTAVACLRSGMDLAAPLGLPEIAGTPVETTPLELLLSHRSGLADHLPLWKDGRDPLRRVAMAKGPGGAVYSDLGYILVGEALARHVGVTDAGDAIERHVALPLQEMERLGTARQLERRGIDLSKRAAPTEHADWRGGVVQGRVHDENAWVLTGAGGSGHAGMFGRVEAVVHFGQWVLEHLSELEPLWRERPGGTLRAGFDGKSVEGSSAGTRMGPRAFGHLGFTGTSLWIDPDAGVVVVMLTNRVHPTRENQKIREARPRVHDLLYDAAMAL
jgi:CubicO group peptidase (beta-lactamase class C family)